MIKKAKPVWVLWLIPLGAIALCVWFIYRDFVASGPLITVYFDDTAGLEAGNTMVNYRGSQIGQVKSISVTEDGKRVKVTARLIGPAKNLARTGSLFWIVRPELKVGAISGLNTIVSGEYVTVQPGQGPATNVFVGAEKPPPEPEPNALLITIHAAALDSMQERSPIFYRGIEVGEVLGYQLSDDARGVDIRARVRRQYAPLVRMNSVFWNAGGIDVHIGLFKGAQISAQSAQTLLSGGIEFATPPQPGVAAENGAVFDINEKPKEAWKDWNPSIPLQLSGQAPAANLPSSGSKLDLK
ncbi:MAG TPA: MlaD family protein [Verrucomicrobiae bacterium]